MATPSDDAPGVVTHSSPASASGFTMIPNAVMLRSDLRPVAKLLYGYLKHLAWRGDSDGIEPLQEVIAADLNISRDTVVSTLRELAKAPVNELAGADAPRLIVSKRRGLGQTNRYIINDPADMPEKPTTRSRKNRLQEAGKTDIPPSCKNLSTREEHPLKSPVADSAVSATAEAVTVEPPAIGKVDGRNLALDALMEVCRWDMDNGRRVAQAAAALNGRFHKHTGKLITQGITHLYWLEVTRFVAANPEHADRLREIRDDPAAYSEALAKAIRRKGELYRLTMPHNTLLTPTALAAWWLDLEKHDRKVEGRGVTTDDIDKMKF